MDQEPSSAYSRRSDKVPRFPACGALALAAPPLGIIALAIFLRYSGEVPPHSSVLNVIPSLIIGVRGPTWLVNWAFVDSRGRQAARFAQFFRVFTISRN